MVIVYPLSLIVPIQTTLFIWSVFVLTIVKWWFVFRGPMNGPINGGLYFEDQLMRLRYASDIFRLLASLNR